MQMFVDTDQGRIILEEDTLVVALDDTGHEDMLPQNGGCFGIAGCAFMARDYYRLIDGPWTYMLQNFFPDVKRPLHAAKHLRNPSAAQLGALCHFFTKFQFFRLAAIASLNTSNPDGYNYIQVVGATLLERLKEIAQYTPFRRVYVIFEASERIEMQVIKSLANKKLCSPTIEAHIELAIMPKAAAASALEVADVIAHTVGSQTRRRHKSGRIGQDFKAIFHEVDKRLVSFMEITGIKTGPFIWSQKYPCVSRYGPMPWR